MIADIMTLRPQPRRRHRLEGGCHGWHRGETSFPFLSHFLNSKLLPSISISEMSNRPVGSCLPCVSSRKRDCHQCWSPDCKCAHHSFCVHMALILVYKMFVCCEKSLHWTSGTYTHTHSRKRTHNHARQQTPVWPGKTRRRRGRATTPWWQLSSPTLWCRVA